MSGCIWIVPSNSRIARTSLASRDVVYASEHCFQTKVDRFAWSYCASETPWRIVRSAIEGQFRQVWCVDFEFKEVDGNVPEVHCMVARELFSRQLIRTWISGELSTPCPLPLGKDILYVAYYANAELKCHLALVEQWQSAWHALLRRVFSSLHFHASSSNF